MDPATLTVAVVAGSLMASIGFDVVMNVAQDYYHTLYTDAFWATSGQNPEIEARLAAEERQIDEMFRRNDVGTLGGATMRTADGTIAVLQADPSGKGRPGLWTR